MRRCVYWFLWVIHRMLCMILFQLRVVNVRHIPRTGGVIVVSNHPTYLDPPILAAAIPRYTSFVSKAELFDMPFVRAFLWLSDSIRIKQRSADVRALRQAVQRLKRGDVVVVFPEGGREACGELGEGLPGAALLSLLSGAPIVPCALIGSYQAWRADSPYPRPHPIKVVFGEPFYVREEVGVNRDELLERATQRMMEAIRTLLEGSLHSRRR